MRPHTVIGRCVCVAAGLAMAGGLTLGCGRGDPADRSDGEPSPSVEPATTAPQVPSPSPSRVGRPVPSVGPYATPTSSATFPDASTIERRILRDLAARVLHQAGVPGRVSGSCEDPIGESGEQVQTTCTVRYEGHDVPFRVTASGSVLVTWVVSQGDWTVLTAAGVRAAFYRYAVAQGAREGTAMCDADLPEHDRVRLEEPLRWHCWFTGPDGETVQRPVAIWESGISF